MKRKAMLPLIIIFALVLVLMLYKKKKGENPQYREAPNSAYPEPIGEDEEKLKLMREKWWELMHRSAPGTDWRTIERANRERAIARKQLLKSRYPNVAKVTAESFANGQIAGEWIEKGSANQAGSMIAVDYVPATNSIYSLGAGGNLWKCPLSRNNWSVINDNVDFKNNILSVFQKAQGGTRIIAASGLNIIYSDDDGATFSPSNGVTFPVGWGGNYIASLIVLKDAARTIYCLTRPWDDNSWSPKYYLYRSADQGQSFTQIYTFNVGDDNKLSLNNPYNTNSVLILDNQSNTSTLRLWSVIGSAVSLANETAVSEPDTKCILKGQFNGSILTLYALLDNKKLYSSTNMGESWDLQSTLPMESWDRLEVSATDPNKVFFGAVNAFRSFTHGTTWSVVNQWYEYYDNVATKLHADIMNILRFTKSDGTPFTIINNHGGVAVSYDDLQTTQNLSMVGLKNAQFYAVLTNPGNPDQLFAGSQDQGFQRNTIATAPGALNFQQVISGDYGYLCLTGSPKHLWTEYPGGAMYYYHDLAGPVTGTWVMPGKQKPNYGWMLPVANIADTSPNTILIGGGNLTGGDGSYLAAVTATSSNTFSANQFTYDFRINSNSGSAGITAIEASKKDAGRLYVAAEDGTFFYSNDNGDSWSKAATFSSPGPWYLYGSSIYSSRKTADLVWFGGSGYSNPPVYKSVNGGQSFNAVSNGLPNTLVHEIVANPEETMLFAATDAGPYVYILADNQWYPLTGVHNPLQTYISVEYIPSSNTVRFGTFGRGIWDFKISYAHIVYTFNGNGNWNNVSNWINETAPPQSFISGSEVVIDPSFQGECIVNIPVLIPSGVTLNIKPGKRIRVNGNLTIQK